MGLVVARRRRAGLLTRCCLQAEDGGVEYRLREGPRNPLEEDPATDTWKPASECDPATVAEAETWLGSPQATFERPAPVRLQDEGRRKRRPDNKRKPTQRTPAHAAILPCDALTRFGRSTAVVDELDLPSVPEYNPTAEQFKDPLAYIQTIYDQAALYGVCLINPPKESWNVSVGPKDWERACETSGRMSAFDVKRQRMLNAQRKTGDPGFEYLSEQYDLARYEKETRKYQERVCKTLPRPVNIDDEIDVETAFFDTMAREAGMFVLHSRGLRIVLRETNPAAALHRESGRHLWQRR